MRTKRQPTKPPFSQGEAVIVNELCFCPEFKWLTGHVQSCDQTQATVAIADGRLLTLYVDSLSRLLTTTTREKGMLPDDVFPLNVELRTVGDDYITPREYLEIGSQTIDGIEYTRFAIIGDKLKFGDTWDSRGRSFEYYRTHEGHIRVVVTTAKGKVFACSWACRTVPTRTEIESAWTSDRRNFLPFDQSSGVYLQ